MSLPLIHHRTPQFAAVLEEVQAGLRELFGTKEDVLILAASGTGAMESAITNLCSAGDEVVFVNGGKFGERWGKLAKAYGLVAHEIPVEWGRAVRPEAVAAALEAHPKARAVYVQGGEPSTCVLHPGPAVPEIPRAPHGLPGARGAAGGRRTDGGGGAGPADGPPRHRRAGHRVPEGPHAAAGARLHRTLGAGMDGGAARDAAALLLRPRPGAEGRCGALHRV